MPPHTGVFRGNDSCANVIRIDVLARQQRSVSNLPSRRKVAQRNIGFARGRGSSRYTNVHTEGSSSIGATNWKRASFSHPPPPPSVYFSPARPPFCSRPGNYARTGFVSSASKFLDKIPVPL